MSEQDSNPEASGKLEQAVMEVAREYRRGTSTQDWVWDDLAEDYSDFGKQITGLREALTVAAEAKQIPPDEPAPIEIQAGIPFMQIEDKGAIDFLGDIVLARIVSPTRHGEPYGDMTTESQSMAAEMGLINGWQGEQAKKVTLESAVGKVLQGKLSVKYQPQS